RTGAAAGPRHLCGQADGRAAAARGAVRAGLDDGDGAQLLLRQQARLEQGHQGGARDRAALPDLPRRPRSHPQAARMSAPHPARGCPQRGVLEGRYVRLEPLAEPHVPALYYAASAPGAEDRFRYLFSAPPASEADMAAWVARSAAKDDPLLFAVVDRDTGLCGGYQALMRIEPEQIGRASCR